VVRGFTSWCTVRELSVLFGPGHYFLKIKVFGDRTIMQILGGNSNIHSTVSNMSVLGHKYEENMQINMCKYICA
jgi:hypothetical protein